MTLMASYLHNRSPSRPLQGMTPYEKAIGAKLNLSYLRIPSYRAYSHVPKETRYSKLANRGKQVIFVGYTKSTSIYVLYDLKTRSIYRSRDVYFIEEAPESLAPIPI